ALGPGRVLRRPPADRGGSRRLWFGCGVCRGDHHPGNALSGAFGQSFAPGGWHSLRMSETKKMSETQKLSGPLVEVEDLKKSFIHMGNKLEVLKGIDLTIRQGEVLSIVGASGAGKSTLLHCIGTLDLPSSGRLRLAGEELTKLSGGKLAAVRNRMVGFVFQFHHLLPEFTALENVMMPGLIGGRSKSEMRQRSRELLETVGLSHRETHRPGELSGGEQQRVAVARALALSPNLLLADEPTGNLDSA